MCTVDFDKKKPNQHKFKLGDILVYRYDSRSTCDQTFEVVDRFYDRKTYDQYELFNRETKDYFHITKKNAEAIFELKKEDEEIMDENTKFKVGDRLIHRNGNLPGYTYDIISVKRDKKLGIMYYDYNLYKDGRFVRQYDNVLEATLELTMEPDTKDHPIPEAKPTFQEKLAKLKEETPEWKLKRRAKGEAYSSDPVIYDSFEDLCKDNRNEKYKFITDAEYTIEESATYLKSNREKSEYGGEIYHSILGDGIVGITFKIKGRFFEGEKEPDTIEDAEVKEFWIFASNVTRTKFYASRREVYDNLLKVEYIPYPPNWNDKDAIEKRARQLAFSRAQLELKLEEEK